MAQDKMQRKEKRAKLNKNLRNWADFPHWILSYKEKNNIFEEKENKGLYLALMSSSHMFKAYPKLFVQT